jgi:hypothetical protein
MNVKLNKTQLAAVHSPKCQIEKVEAQLGRGPEVRFVVVMSLTRGELHCLKRIVEARTDTGDDIADDLHAYIKNALENDKIADQNGDF